MMGAAGTNVTLHFSIHWTIAGKTHHTHTPPKGGVCSVSHVNLAALTRMPWMGRLGWHTSLKERVELVVYGARSLPPG